MRRHLLGGWHEVENTPSVLSTRHDVERVAIGIDHLSHERHRQMVLVEHGERHAAHQSFDHFSAFRIDVDLIAPALLSLLLHRIERGDAVVGQLSLWEPLIVGKVVDDGVGIVAVLLWLVEDRDDAGEAGLIAEIEHIACVGPDFVEAGSDDGVDGDVAMRLPFLQPELRLMDHVATGIEQIYIEHLADVGGESTVGACDVCLEIHPLTLEITGVVEVHIDFLLRISHLKHLDMLHHGDHAVESNAVAVRLCVNTSMYAYIFHDKADCRRKYISFFLSKKKKKKREKRKKEKY